MPNRLDEMRRNLVGTATGVTIIMLVIVTGALTISAGVLIGFDLIASFYSWGQKIAHNVDLPYPGVLSVVVTGLPTLIQMGYVASKAADLEFGDSKQFRNLYWISLVLDTVMDTIQMNQGSLISFGISVFVAVALFWALSEFLFIFAGSIFVGMVYRLMNEEGLLQMAWTDTTSRATRGGQSGNRN